MKLEIEVDKVAASIQEQLTKNVKDGVSYEVRKSLGEAVEKAMTPEVVRGFVESAMLAMTDKSLTQQIVTEMHAAIGSAIRLTLQESLLSVIAHLRGWKRDYINERENRDKFDALREQLFPPK